jgi:hypothetical protein
MIVLIAAFGLWFAVGWKFAVAFLFGGLVQALGHVCTPERDHAHVRTVLDEQRKREGFLRHS